MKDKRLFANSPAALILFNDQAQIIDSNTAAQTLFGYSAKELINFDFFELIPKHLDNVAKNSWQNFLTVQQQNNFTIIRTKDQQLHYVSFFAKANITPGVHFASVHPIEIQYSLKHRSNKGENLEHILNNFLRKDLLQRVATQDYELSKLFSAEKHFYNLFKNLPIPIIESDCSEIKEILNRDKEKYGDNPKQYFIDHPDETNALIQHCSIREINKAALRFFKISNKITRAEDLIKIYASIVDSSAPAIFDGFLKNAKNIMYETEVNDFHGERHSVIMRVSAESTNYTRTFVTFEDISASKKIQEELEVHVKERTTELEAANKKLRREINFREQITRDLHQNEERYRKLYTIYPVGIFHVNQNRVTTYANAKLGEIEGVSMEELQNGTWINYIHPEDRDRVINSWENAFYQGEPLNIEYRFKHGTKNTWVNVQTVPEYDEASELVGHVGIVSDITRLHEAEEQLKQSQIEMAHFARVNAMGEVASGIAHELNQPLTAISNFMSGCKRRLLSLNNKDIPQDILDAIENAATQAQRAGNIIHNLKDFLRKGELSKQKFDLNSAIQDVIIFSKKSVSENKITINLKLEKNLAAINADKIHIEQVILNMVNNAIDAINESKRSTKEIIIRTKLYKKHSVRISIGDSGMGINKDLIRTIFNPFVTTKPEGMGIGLSLCHNIIDKHHGTISVVSRRGRGAIFHITLPVE